MLPHAVEVGWIKRLGRNGIVLAIDHADAPRVIDDVGPHAVRDDEALGCSRSGVIVPCESIRCATRPTSQRPPGEHAEQKRSQPENQILQPQGPDRAVLDEDEAARDSARRLRAGRSSDREASLADDVFPREGECRLPTKGRVLTRL